MQIATWVRPEDSLKDADRRSWEFFHMYKSEIKKAYILAWNKDDRVYYGKKSVLGYDVLEETAKHLRDYKIEGGIWVPFFAGFSRKLYPNLRIREVDEALWSFTEKALQLRLSQIKELAENKEEFTEIHLDYLRAPQKERRYFELQYGGDLTQLVTEAVKSASRIARKNGKKLSVAVYKDNEGGADTSYEGMRICQDWAPWVQRNVVDEAVVMLYTFDMASFSKRVVDCQKICEGTDALRIGIAVNPDKLYPPKYPVLTKKEFDAQLGILQKNDVRKAAVFAWHGIANYPGRGYLQYVQKYA
jgi:hypothetical protein